MLRAFSFVYMLPPLPRRSGWVPTLLNPPAVSTFPERVTGSVCASTFSRLAQRSLTLRPVHSRCHQFVTCFIPKASTVSLPPQLLIWTPPVWASIVFTLTAGCGGSLISGLHVQSLALRGPDDIRWERPHLR